MFTLFGIIRDLTRIFLNCFLFYFCLIFNSAIIPLLYFCLIFNSAIIPILYFSFNQNKYYYTAIPLEPILEPSQKTRQRYFKSLRSRFFYLLFLFRATTTVELTLKSFPFCFCFPKFYPVRHSRSRVITFYRASSLVLVCPF